MSKKNKSGSMITNVTSVPLITEDGEICEGPVEGPKVLSQDDVRKMFDAYDTEKKIITDAMLAIEQATVRRQECVKAIFDATGQKRFKRAGKELVLVVKEYKNTGKTSYFFRGDGEEDNDVFVV